MKTAITALIALAAIASPLSPALAKGPDHCPPGLAKKSPACIPPGQAKKYDQYRRYDGGNWRGDYRIGESLPDWYENVRNPRDYGLQVIVNGSDYYMHDGVIYRVSTETREVLELFEAVNAVLN